MNDAEYRRCRSGARVRSLRAIRNGYGTVPEGTLGTIRSKTRGMTVDFDGCDCCGVAMSVSHLRAGDVDLVGDPDPQGLTGQNERRPRRQYEL